MSECYKCGKALTQKPHCHPCTNKEISELEGAIWTEKELNKRHLETIDKQKDKIVQLEAVLKAEQDSNHRLSAKELELETQVAECDDEWHEKLSPYQIKRIKELLEDCGIKGEHTDYTKASDLLMDLVDGI